MKTTEIDRLAAFIAAGVEADELKDAFVQMLIKGVPDAIAEWAAGQENWPITDEQQAHRDKVDAEWEVYHKEHGEFLKEHPGETFTKARPKY